MDFELRTTIQNFTQFKKNTERIEMINRMRRTESHQKVSNDRKWAGEDTQTFVVFCEWSELSSECIEQWIEAIRYKLLHDFLFIAGVIFFSLAKHNNFTKNRFHFFHTHCLRLPVCHLGVLTSTGKCRQNSVMSNWYHPI